MKLRRVLVTISAVIVSVAGCGPSNASSSPSGVAASASAGTPASPSASTALSDGLLVNTIDRLPGAVIQIETTGTFRDPFEGRQKITGRGSGFVVDPSGIAVTNNHVVTGADTVTVWVGVERAEHKAEVLGASECSDLAVVRIDGGGSLPYLEWYQGDIKPGLEIYAAGFPLGDPEFTLSRGIVSRARGIIDESWASVDDSIEHDANINPGSSGGPVVSDDAKVVAVDYAGDETTRQSFAISRDEALRILADLEKGQDVSSVGLNGVAIDPDNDFGITQGIWVSSVKPESAAAGAGILPGDIVTKLAGKRLAAQGTMKEYCDVLRAQKAGDKLPFTVYREDSRETLSAELGGTPLQPGFAFATTLGDGPPADPTELAFDEPSEDPGRLAFQTPEAWSDVLDQPWSFGGVDIGTGRVVSTDVKAFKDGWRTAGVFVAVSDSITKRTTIDGLLDAERSRFERSCDYVRRQSFRRGAYDGKFDLWKGCGGTDSRFLTIAAGPKDRSHMVYLQFQATTNADLAVLDRVLATLKVSVPGS
jgi:serine protease Do